jgi:hypothetical protein
MGYKSTWEREIWISDSLLYFKTPRSVKIYSDEFSKLVEIDDDNYISTLISRQYYECLTIRKEKGIVG